MQEAKSQIASIQRQKAQTQEEFKRDRLKELADAETQASALDQELTKAEERERLKRITAPVAGTVQQLALHTVDVHRRLVECHACGIKELAWSLLRPLGFQPRVN